MLSAFSVTCIRYTSSVPGVSMQGSWSVLASFVTVTNSQLSLCRLDLWCSCCTRREYNTLSCTAGGKQLVLHGGHSRMHESVGRETAVLHLDSLTWEVPETAMLPDALLGHSSSVVGRNKLLVFGGSRGEQALAAVQQLATDSMRWTNINPSSTSAPQPRLSHAAVALSDKVGGCAASCGTQHCLCSRQLNVDDSCSACQQCLGLQAHLRCSAVQPQAPSMGLNE
jgi:hypothetical protein